MITKIIGHVTFNDFDVDSCCDMGNMEFFLDVNRSELWKLICKTIMMGCAELTEDGFLRSTDRGREAIGITEKRRQA
jgi:hypothetical protein